MADTRGRQDVVDVVVFLVIFLAGLGATIVFFRYLDSSASTNGATGLALGGALLGGLVTWSSLGSLYLQISKNSRNRDSLQALVERLDLELVQRSPVPTGYEREIDERHGLVLSRPVTWRPLGGILFDWIAPSARDDDYLSAQFRVYRFPRDAGPRPFGDEIREFATSQAARFGATLVEESIRIGGRADEDPGLFCPKFTLQCYAIITHDPAAPPNGDPPSLAYLTTAQVVEIAGRDLDRAVRDRVPRGFEDAKRFVDEKAKAKVTLTRLVENFAIDATRGLPETIRMVIDGSPLGKETASEELVDSSPPDGVGVGVADAAAGAAAALGQHDKQEVVLPVNRVLIAADHANLEQRFMFEFVDNTGDFLASSRELTEVLRTVRFIK
jgi:hypothetical protein